MIEDWVKLDTEVDCTGYTGDSDVVLEVRPWPRGASRPNFMALSQDRCPWPRPRRSMPWP